MFFDKCFNGTLQENDFEINSKQQKGSVRRKIKILSKAMNMPLLINDMQIEENLEKKKKKHTLFYCHSKCKLHIGIYFVKKL